MTQTVNTDEDKDTLYSSTSILILITGPERAPVLSCYVQSKSILLYIMGLY